MTVQKKKTCFLAERGEVGLLGRLGQGCRRESTGKDRFGERGRRHAPSGGEMPD